VRQTNIFQDIGFPYEWCGRKWVAFGKDHTVEFGNGEGEDGGDESERELRVKVRTITRLEIRQRGEKMR
jgi:hypothetical protein